MTPVASPPCAPTPELSVVIASVNGQEMLEPTLDSLDSLPERDRMEVIVVETLGGATRAHLRARRSPVLLIESPRQSIPRLRYQGVLRAKGRLVAILEDHVRVEHGWAASLIDGLRGPWGAVGGPVENGKTGLVNWAVYFCEYTSYMAPVVEGETRDLPGNNIAFKRSHLLRHAHLLADGKWESWINDRLQLDGIPIAGRNSMIVRHLKPFRFRPFLVQRYHFARSYAGMRRSEQSWPKRLVYGSGSLLLPLLLGVRVVRTVLRKKRNRGQLLLCSPLLFLFLTVGACGEMIGYLLGPGASLEKVD
ncbi:MAG: hypothetical protein NVSMB9_05590 [Isosphaeraceae bacterium]